MASFTVTAAAGPPNTTPMTITGAMSFDATEVHLNLPVDLPNGIYTLATSSATPVLTGTFPAPVVDSGSYGTGGSGIITLDTVNNLLLLTVSGVTGGSAYDTWAMTTHGLSGGDAAFDFDYDKDGINNGLEWIFGGIPTANDNPSILPTVTGNAVNGLTLVFNRESDSIPETTLVVEWDSDLSGFANSLTIGTVDVGPSGNNPTIDIDAPSVGKITVNIPAANAVGGKIFARLKATKP